MLVFLNELSFHKQISNRQRNWNSQKLKALQSVLYKIIGGKNPVTENTTEIEQLTTYEHYDDCDWRKHRKWISVIY